MQVDGTGWYVCEGGAPAASILRQASSTSTACLLDDGVTALFMALLTMVPDRMSPL